MSNITALFYKPLQINASFTSYCPKPKKKIDKKEKKIRLQIQAWEAGDVQLLSYTIHSTISIVPL